MQAVRSFLILLSNLLIISSKTASSIVKLIFPGVARRFETSADWHIRTYGFEPLFGYYWNLCVNGLFFGQKRIHCLPHADAKNIVGVCLLAIFLIPGMCSGSTMNSLTAILKNAFRLSLQSL